MRTEGWCESCCSVRCFRESTEKMVYVYFYVNDSNVELLRL